MEADFNAGLPKKLPAAAPVQFIKKNSKQFQ